MNLELVTIIFIPIVLAAIFLLVIKLRSESEKKKMIVNLSQYEITNIIEKQKEQTTHEEEFKLIQAGITKKELNEAKLMFMISGLLISVFSILYVPMPWGIILAIPGIILTIFSGSIYVWIAKSERVSKIESDLGTFLDLVNIILEAGGSLKNAFLVVSQRGKNIICDDLLREIAILEYEMTNYSTKVAYENLKNRIDSVEMDKVVDFLILSEETGIGVKSIFTTQSKEMREEEFYKMKGKVSTLNLYLMIVIFVFVLPAIGAFIALPMRAGTLTMGF